MNESDAVSRRILLVSDVVRAVRDIHKLIRAAVRAAVSHSHRFTIFVAVSLDTEEWRPRQLRPVGDSGKEDEKLDPSGCQAEEIPTSE